MKKLLIFFFMVVFGVGVCQGSSKIVDLNFKEGKLDDARGNLTASQLSRVSAATFVQNGLLQTAWGNRSQLIDTTAQNDITTWWSAVRIGNSTAQAIIADTNNQSHYLTKSALISSGVTYVISAEMKKGAVDWAKFWSIAGDSDHRGTYNLNTGVLGTPQDSVTNIEDKGDGWYKCSMIFTATDADVIYIYAMEGEVDSTFAGDDSSVSTYIRNIMLEELPSGNAIGDDLFDQETLGSELHTDANAASDPNGNEANATTGFSGSGATIASVADPQTGSYAIEATAASTRSDRTEITITVENGFIYKVVFWAKRGSQGTAQNIDFWTGVVESPSDTVDSTTYSQFTYYVITNDTSLLLRFYANSESAGSVGDKIVVDNLSVTKVTAPPKGIPVNDPWPALAGAEAIDDPNDRDFRDETVDGDPAGEWNVTTDGSGTVEFDDTDLSFAGESGDDKQMMIDAAGDEAYLYASLATVAQISLAADTLYKVTAKIAVPAANTSKTVFLAWGGVDVTPGTTADVVLSGDTWTEVSGYFYFTTDIAGYFYIGFPSTASPAAGDLMYIDDITIRPVQLSWAPHGSNILQIDESENALSITYVDNNDGAFLFFKDVTDLSSDLTAGESYLLRFDGKVSADSTIYTRVYDGNVYIETSIIDTSWETKEVIFIAGSVDGCFIRFESLDADDILYIRNISIKKIPNMALLAPSDFINSATILAKARFETDGLLIEGEATNFVDYSEDFSQWIKLRAAMGGSITDPEGNTAIDLGIIGTAVENSHYVRYTLGSLLNSDIDHVASVFVKAGNRNWIRIRINNNAGGSTDRFFDLTNAVVGTGGLSTTHGIEKLNGGWVRCWLMFDSDAGANYPIFYVYAAEDDNDVVYTGDGSTADVYVYGAQFEQSPYPTSYIPTDGNQVTRTSEAADGTYGYRWTMSAALKNILSDALPGGGATPAIGTLIVEWKASQDYDASASVSAGIVSIRDHLSSLFYNNAGGGDFISYDGTNAESLTNINWSKDDTMISVVRWNDIADSGAGYLHILNKKNTTWNLNVGNESAMDGAFTLGNYLWLNYGNEIPIHISKVIIYNEYLSDSQLELEIWEEQNFIRGIVQDVVRPVVRESVRQ